MLRRRRELGLFVVAYLLYNAGRAVANGNMDLARSNARWTIDFQSSETHSSDTTAYAA